MDTETKIEKVREFANSLKQYGREPAGELRTFLNENAPLIRRIVTEAGCMKLFVAAPPPLVGGLVHRDVDPFDSMFQNFWGMSLNPKLIDMLDQTVGVLKTGQFDDTSEGSTGSIAEFSAINSGYVFIAMPMAAENPEYDDVHDAIKAVSKDCGLTAERVDDVQSNDRITDQLLASIRKAQFVIVDLTDSRPNVFYEAGFAHGIGKIPIYIARKGTDLEFDLKDYPVIFFQNMRELRRGLENRLRALAE